MPLEQDVLEIGQQLEKLVADGKSDNETVSDLLKCLKDLPVTLDILQKTRIGMAVNVVRKASSKENVQALAKTLIKSWKKLLDNQDKSKVRRQSSQENSISRISSSGSISRSDSNSSLSNGEKSRSSSSNIVSFPPTQGDKAVRTRCQEMISNSLKCEDKSDFDASQVSAEIEENIFQNFKETSTKYKNRVKSIVMNLRDKRNPDLQLLVIDGVIEPKRFANMTSEEMACDKLKQERKDITAQAIKDHQLAKSGGTATGQFKCGRCGKRNTTYNQVQTRSADEPMTTFVLCLECGNRWKFY